jgi:fructose-bisphosphate aldolase class 1
MSSRIAFHIDFEDYSVDELCDITKLMVRRKNMQITDEAMAKLKADYEKVSKKTDYGNGRYVRKLLEEAEMNLAQRIFPMVDADVSTQVMTTIEACDIPEHTVDKILDQKTRIGFCA